MLTGQELSLSGGLLFLYIGVTFAIFIQERNENISTVLLISEWNISKETSMFSLIICVGISNFWDAMLLCNVGSKYPFQFLPLEWCWYEMNFQIAVVELLKY